MARPRKPWYRKSRDWWMVEIAGEQIKLCRGENNRGEAELRFHQLMAARLASEPVDSGNPTVASLFEAFLDFAVRRDAASTFYERKIYLQKFADAYGNVPVRELRPFHLTRWVDEHPSWTSDWTRSYAIRNVKRPFNWAIEQGLISANPVAAVRHRPGERRRPMEPKQYKALLKAVGSKSRIGEILRFIAQTGCRPKEARMLQWNDVDVARSVVVIKDHKTAKTQKVQQPRIIPLVPGVVSLLDHVRKRGDHPEFVFVNGRKQRWGRCSIQQAIRRARRRIGLPEEVVLYGLRHHFGTDSIRNGNDLKTTATLMGHTSVRMTEHYVHLAGEYDHLRAAMQRATKSV